MIEGDSGNYLYVVKSENHWRNKYLLFVKTVVKIFPRLVEFKNYDTGLVKLNNTIMQKPQSDYEGVLTSKFVLILQVF